MKRYRLRAAPLALLWFMSAAAAVFAQDFSLLTDRVSIEGQHFRYYVYYDMFGNSPGKRGPGRLSNTILPGDQIAIRFYPNTLFSFDTDKIVDNDFRKKSMRGGFIVFPFSTPGPDTFTVQTGYGGVYFATNKAGGSYRIRVAHDSTALAIDAQMPRSKLDSVYDVSSVKLDEFTKKLQAINGFEKTVVRGFENVPFGAGSYTLELFLVTPNVVQLLDRIRIKVMDVYSNVTVFYSRDLSGTKKIPMEMPPLSAFFEGLLNSSETTVGIVSVNVVYDYAKGAWFYEQAPSVATNRKLKIYDDKIAIVAAPELPSSLRARAGFGVFNYGREARLITNFVLVLSPKDYFIDSTPFFKRFNPTMGIQIGGTGTQDAVFLIGTSFKLITQGDLIAGLRFGLDPAQPWTFRSNFYFGMSLDPGLFGQLKSSR